MKPFDVSLQELYIIIDICIKYLYYYPHLRMIFLCIWLRPAGPMQLCAGQESGCEAAVHVIQKLFRSPEVEPVLLDR